MSKHYPKLMIFDMCKNLVVLCVQSALDSIAVPMSVFQIQPPTIRSGSSWNDAI